jgi:hypothetical protein
MAVIGNATNPPAGTDTQRAKADTHLQAGDPGGGTPARPTTGQLWPRGQGQ